MLDSSGVPLLQKRARPELAEFLGPQRRAPIQGSYDAARDSDEFRNYWAHADGLDADSAHSPSVRRRLVQRSRYEIGNNGYADGLAQTYANYLIGLAPALRMQTADQLFNRAVETRWKKWAKKILLRRKLWCMAHAKVQDGESFGVLRTNPRGGSEQLDLVLIETEQCASPDLRPGEPLRIDGIRFDAFGNAVMYDILRTHPGSQSLRRVEQEQVPARFVTHWFGLRRPGQHRAVPEFRSTLNCGAQARRWREATIAAAESAADIAALLKTTLPGTEPDAVAPLTTVEFQKRMMVALPMGWDGMQMKAEHPNATYESFHRAQINEQARPKSIPYNIAACDSSSYNYSSGRLDHQTFYGVLDLDRADCDDLVLDPIFTVWFERAALVEGWDVDPQDVPEHVWDWPQHPVADINSEATADDKKLRNGSLAPSEIAARDGVDYLERITAMARDYGITVEEMQQMLLRQNFNSAAAQPDAPVGDPAANKNMNRSAS